MKKSVQQITVIFLVLVTFVWSEGLRNRPVNWAQPVIGSGLKNLNRLNDEVYRSEQPNSKEFKKLEEFGIKSVINLRNWHDDDKETKNTSLKVTAIKMRAGKLDYENVVEVMKAIKDVEKPVLIHCKHGADRTGAMSAAYRILFEGWTQEAALDELRYGEYNFHTRFKNIPKVILAIDPEQLKRDVFGEE